MGSFYSFPLFPMSIAQQRKKQHDDLLRSEVCMPDETFLSKEDGTPIEEGVRTELPVSGGASSKN